MNRVNVMLLVLLALQAGWLGYDRLTGVARHAPRRTVTTEYLFPDASAETLESFEVKMGGRTSRVVRSEGVADADGPGWVVDTEGGVKADEAAAMEVMRALGQMQPGKIVSENADKHLDFQVAGDQAIEVTAMDRSGSEVAHFILGKTTKDWSSVYLRYPHDGDDVMLVKGNVRHVFSRGDNQRGSWRDLSLLSFDPRRVRTIEMQGPDETIVMQRIVVGEKASDDDEWKLLSPTTGPVNRHAGNQLAFAASELRADALAQGNEPPTERGLEPPDVRAVITLDDGEIVTFDIGREVDQKRFVRRPGTEEVFLVPAVKLYGFLRSGEELLEQADTSETPDVPGVPPSDGG